MEQSALEQALAQLKANEERLNKQNQVLLQLAKSKSIDEGSSLEAFKEITKAATETLNCQRSSIWIYGEDRDRIICVNLYESHKQQHAQGFELVEYDFPAYFKYLSEERSLAANDAHTDPNTFEFSEVYLKPLGISSMLDAPIRSGGEMIGVICNEHVGEKREWTVEEQNFAGSLADIASRALEAEKRKHAQDQLRLINQNLEKLVMARTMELQRKVTEITELKNLQDGDYFLTSLIEKPLATNRNRSEDVSVEFFIRQKKQVIFKGKKAEVGGDICISGNLYFESYSRRYIAFLNADAMGKSIQGAGGAIVIGTAFNYLLHRSAREGRVLDVDPSTWLRDAYLELNSIFRTFDGSMMVSCVMGLVGEKDGDLYIINAEHPNPVLYRDKLASFLYSPSHLPKLGNPFLEKMEVMKYSLLEGDIVIIGSDGKDDLRFPGLEEDAEGKINEDEGLFLEIVEASNADLKTIYESIESKGEIIDDISLIKIGYKLKSQKSRGDVNEYLKTPIDQVLKMVEAKNYEFALPYLLSQSHINPKNSKIWNALGVVYYNLGKYMNAELALTNAMSYTKNQVPILKNLDKVRYKIKENE